MRIVFVFLLSFLLVACTAVTTPLPVAPTALPTLAVTSVTTPLPVAPTALPTLAVTSVTPPPVPETLPPSRTPLPTLSIEEADTRVKQLMKDNAGCTLPCWWGINPGETSWDDAEAFLQTIDPTVGNSSNPTHYSFSYQFPEGPSGYGVFAQFDVDNFGIVKKISVWKTAINLSLPELLVTVGKPDKIFLQVYSFMPDTPPPFIVLLAYEDLHIVAEFKYRTVPRGTTLLGCIDPNTPSLTLYAPNVNISSELGQKFETELAGGWAPYRLLEDSTKIDTETFYQIFKDPNNATCIETSADLWKMEQ